MTKNIQDVVDVLTSRLARYKLAEKDNEKEIIFVSGLSKEDADWLTTTLTHLVKEGEAGERSRIIEKIEGSNLGGQLNWLIETL